MPVSQAFPFLRLPPELRLMVYQRIDPRPEFNNYVRFSNNTISTLTLVTGSKPTTSILATCSQIYHEAKDVVTAICRQHSKDRHPAPCIEEDSEALGVLRIKGGLFMEILECCRRFARGARTSSVPWHLDDDIKVLNDCITQFGYSPTRGALNGALALRVFVRTAARALLLNNGPSPSLYEAGRIGITLSECWDVPPRPQDNQLAYRIIVIHQLPHKCSGHVSVQRALNLGDLLESEEFEGRWFQAVMCSLDAMDKYTKGSVEQEKFKVVVIVGKAG